MQTTIGALFLPKHAGRKVVASGGGEEGAVVTRHMIGFAGIGVVADGSGGPHIVERPHHTLARKEDFAEVAQREKSLVDPMQMHHVGFLKFGQARDVKSGVGDGHLEEIAPREAVGRPNHHTLPKEAQAPLPVPMHSVHECRRVVGVAHEHTCFHALSAEGVHQAGGGNRCSSFLL